MKKRLLALVIAATMLFSLAACGGKANSGETNTPANSNTPVEEVKTPSDIEKLTDGQMVDGKFKETKKISVEVYDRDGATPANDNVWTDWIKKQMLDKYNVEVTYVAVPRWTEVDQINNLLAAQSAPDICYTYSYATVQTYADMAGVTDLNPYLTKYKSLLPDLWNWLKDENIYCDQDPTTGTVWAIEGRRNNTYRINTFVRQDWLDKLGLKAPTTTQEFEDMLVAFKNNAETLLGDAKDQMIPLMVTSDVGWTAANLIESFMDPAITDKELYVNGFDDRKYTQNGTKEAVKLLNKWYNNGLMWKDFALYPSGDSTADDLCKAGYVGAFMHNYDYPFRNAENSFNAVLAATYGENAKFVAINCFTDKNGKYTKYSYSAAGDRKAFFPATNKEPLASLLYLNFISSPEAVEYLQKGVEGINHKVLESGAIAISAVDEANKAYTQNSGQNIDLTMTCNGLRLSTEELTQKSLAYTYAMVDPADVANAMVQAGVDAVAPKNVQVGTIQAESEGTDLTGKRDAGFCNSVVCSPAEFDATWEQHMKEYMKAGGQAIADERKAAWEKTYGTADMLK
ncbi:MAG: sugar ABC transporter substrate-binding protein [Lachnospiraceae bacterium]|nr:sugar ABC transporter substrate-binding protein [Lachnospiraceae bacterium]